MRKADRRPVTAGRDSMIVARLDEWGEWLARQIDRAGAGSLVSSIYSGRPVVQTSAQAGQEARAVSEAALTNRLVVDLGRVDSALQLAVFATHAPRACRIGDGARLIEGGRGLSVRQNARRLGCSHTALAARLARADLMLLGWLRDHAANQHRQAERELGAILDRARADGGSVRRAA